MSVINANPLMLGDAGYNIGRSLRFRSSASAYLNRTPASSSSRTTWTWSGWVKRGALSSAQGLFAAYSAATDAGKTELIFLSDNIYLGGGATVWATTTQVFRDPSAWYHIILSVDTTQATNTNRWKLYVNGSQVTAFSTANYPAQNATWAVNSNTAHYCGASYAGGVAYYLDGYQAEVNFIDGQALTPSSFGQTDAITGVWVPKKYTGTYGTNGFYLPFTDNTSATTLAYDKSGNGNNWTPNNISTTAGATYDSMTDVPTLTSATAANYCVLNPLNLQSSMSISEGNLQTQNTATVARTTIGTMGMPSGKWYAEMTAIGTGLKYVGICTTQPAAGDYLGIPSGSYAYNSAAQKVNNGGTSVGYGATWTAGDVIGIAFDNTTGSLEFYKNGTSQGVAFTGIANDTYFYGFSSNSASGNGVYANFGQRPFTYTPPTGFKALNTFNLPDPTIKKPNQYMDATLWTGNGTSQSITNSGSFQPDLVWAKDRNNTGGFNHCLVDSVRGTGLRLRSNTTDAEASTSSVTAFNSNGFSIGSYPEVNQNTDSFVGWQWKKGATPGFDIVTYTGTGANQNISHSLGVAPKMMIVKARSAGGYSWGVYHVSTGAGGAMWLNATDAYAASSNRWNNTAPTSSVFTVGTDTNLNNNGTTYVAYLFAEIAGFSKFGSYTGNGVADGPFVYCGFRPKYVLTKSTNNAYTWLIYDSVRLGYNEADTYIQPNLSNAEATTAGFGLDLTSNGFKVRATDGTLNANGSSYIYAAFAENHFKYSNAR